MIKIKVYSAKTGEYKRDFVDRDAKTVATSRKINTYFKRYRRKWYSYDDNYLFRDYLTDEYFPFTHVYEFSSGMLGDKANAVPLYGEKDRCVHINEGGITVQRVGGKLFAFPFSQWKHVIVDGKHKMMSVASDDIIYATQGYNGGIKLFHKNKFAGQIQLAPSFYGIGRYVRPIVKHALVEVGGEMYVKNDIGCYLDRELNPTYYIEPRNTYLGKHSLRPLDVAHVSFVDPRNEQFDEDYEDDDDEFLRVDDEEYGGGLRLTHAAVLQKDLDMFAMVEPYGMYTLAKDVDKLHEVIDADTFNRTGMLQADYIKALKLGLSCQGLENENNPEYINPDFKRTGGGILIESASGPPIVSKTFTNVGGKRYTFGIEYETAAGNLGTLDLASCNFDKFGDRSIPAYEYVTGVMSGDAGLAMVQKQCSVLSKRTMVNKECSVHIHIGGTNAGDIDSPSFNRDFSYTAIRLGAMLEKELYEISPERRSPRLKHTSSIMGFSGITPQNADWYLGSYIFSDSDIPSKRYIFTKNRNSSHDIGRWNASRYRWLNLNHCNSRSRFKTIEFRMFAGTSSYEKVKSYLLICMAFVWAVENRRNKIWSSRYSLPELIKDAYAKSPEIRINLLQFIQKEKDKYNRTNIYK